MPLGDVLPALASRWTAESDESRRDRVERLIRVMRARVADPTLRLEPVAKIAWAIVEGAIDERSILSLVAQVEDWRARGRIRSSAGALFVGSAKKIFAQRGVPWTR